MCDIPSHLMLAKTSTIACGVLGLLFAARVHAQTQDPETKPPDAGAAAAEGSDSLTLPKGRAVIDAYLAINLSDGAAFKPVSLSPDIWYGVNDDITAGLVHSTVGQSGFINGTLGRSLCLTGSDNGCSDVYSNVGLEGRYKLKSGGPLVYAADAGFYINRFSDPSLLDIKLGALGRWHEDKIAVEAAPSIQIGLTNRSVTAGGVTITVNRDVLFLPATFLYALNPMITLAAQSGFVLPLEDTGDTYAIPLTIGAFYHVNESLDVNLSFGLPALVGGGSGTGFDSRALTLGGSYAL
jgi:hypothetical protein